MTTRNYRAVTAGQSLGDAAIVTFNWTGEALKPPAPVHLRGARNAAGDLLIEWTRRERVPMPLRDNAGVPMTEEKEIYLLEIYSGSTLKRRVRNPSARITVVLTDWNPLEGSYAITSFGGVTNLGSTPGIVRSMPIFNGDFIFEFNCGGSLEPPAYIGVLPEGTPVNASWPAIFSTTGYPYLFNDLGVGLKPQSDANYTQSFVEHDKFSIHRLGGAVKFYKNYYQSAAPVPFYEMSMTSTEERLRVFMYFAASSAGIESSAIDAMQIRAYNYTVSQQITDFGSAQSSIKVRVMQESALVGVGSYIEANL